MDIIDENQNEKMDWRHICGGVMFVHKFLLTAATCILLLEKHSESDRSCAEATIGQYLNRAYDHILGIVNFERHPHYDVNNLKETSGYDIGVVLVGVYQLFLLL